MNNVRDIVDRRAGARRLVRIGLLLALLPVAAVAGTIRGTIRAEAPEGVEPAGAAGGAYASRKWKFVEKIDYAKLTDFVVYVDQAVGGTGAAEPAAGAVTTQKDASFEPHVLPVAVGTTVRWPNQDDIYHNVFSMSEPKPFDLGLYHSEKTPEIRFDRAGRVDVFCAIHSKMHCIILVVPNSFFAKADARGRFVIKDVPAGTYKLRGWHERLPSRVLEVVVPAEGEVKVDFVLGLSELPRY